MLKCPIWELAYILNSRHLFVGAVLQVQYILGEGGGFYRPPRCSAEGELGGQEKNWGEPPNLPAFLTLIGIATVGTCSAYYLHNERRVVT